MIKFLFSLFCAKSLSFKLFIIKKMFVFSRYTNADLKIFLNVRIYSKTMPSGFRILNPNKSQITYPWSFEFFIRIRLIFSIFYYDMVYKWDQDHGTLRPGTRDPPQSLKVGPGTPSPAPRPKI